MSVTIRFEDGDFEIGSTGEQVLVSGAEKAAQDTLDALLQPFDADSDSGNEMFDPDGSPIVALGSALVGAATAKTHLQNAVGRLRDKQSRSARTDRTERITQHSVIVRTPPNDPTSLLFYVQETVNDEKIGIAREISMRHLNDSDQVVGGTDR